MSGKRGELTSGTINLTVEGTVDWAQIPQREHGKLHPKEQAETKIKNFQVIDGIDGKINDGTFSF